jgi:eukaryotic-like serine/threonine-protein kinase
LAHRRNRGIPITAFNGDRIQSPFMPNYPPDRWRRIDALLARALEHPEDRQEAFVQENSEGDDELRDEVLSLLRGAEDLDSLLDQSAAAFAAPLVIAGRPLEDSRAGEAIGPYRLVREIGRGGMGAVYLAERADGEFEKQVALKLIKLGMDTDEIIGRFRYERRILASLEHPHIARLYDGGVSEDGRPFLVMELVVGEPITMYCDSHRLSIDQRLRLFRRVCEAVQYAHQNLVIHRDVKPSNILVGEDGTPKLLDFGIAKLLADEDPSAPHTRTGVRVLTPEYAAPEQIRGEPVTTASDVYALGAVLYELLTGRRPFDDENGVRRMDAPTAERAVIRPSTAVERPQVTRRPGGHAGVPATTASIAAKRASTPVKLRRRLRGDLDTILLKALEVDPRRRYQSALQLLDDIERHRAGLPVLARPIGIAYRVTRFANRHRLALAMVTLLILSLLGGLGASLWQAGRATTERDRAEVLRAVAEDERDAAEQVAGFLEQLFGASNPSSSRPGRMDTLRIGAFLERGAERLGDEFRERPAIRARMLGVIGRAYRGLGAYDAAEPLLTEALEVARSAHGDRHMEVADAMNALGNLYLDLQRPSEAENLHGQALAIRREVLPPDHQDIAASLNNLAAALQDRGRLTEAEPLYDELLAMHRRFATPDSAGLADAMNNRMVLAFRQDDFAAALPLAREILAINRSLFGDNHPRIAQDLNNLGLVLSRTGALEEAEALMRESLAMNREIFGGEHPNIAAGADNLASVWRRLGRVEEAESLLQEAIDMKRRLLGPTHPSLAPSLSSYADLLADRAAYDTAEAFYREAISINRTALGANHPSVGAVTGRLAQSLCARGQFELGQALFHEALALLRSTFTEEHSSIAAIREAAPRCSPEAEPVAAAYQY